MKRWNAACHHVVFTCHPHQPAPRYHRGRGLARGRYSGPVVRRHRAPLRTCLMPHGVLRGAFVGFGNVAAEGHLPGWRLRKDVAIVAATDVASARRDAFSAACPGGRWYDSVDRLLAGEALDFVDICAPPGSHAALIRRALDAGFHVLCEKPLVTRVAQARSRWPLRDPRRPRRSHGSQLAQGAGLPQNLRARRRRRDRRRAIGRLADLADPARGRGGPGRRPQLARRSGNGRRRHPV